MELEGERFRPQEIVSKSLQVDMSGQPAREAWGPFIATQGYLLVGVLETQTCLGWGPDTSGKCYWNPVRKSNKSSWDLATENFG
jgi:hypothetical protein